MASCTRVQERLYVTRSKFILLWCCVETAACCGRDGLQVASQPCWQQSRVVSHESRKHNSENFRVLSNWNLIGLIDHLLLCSTVRQIDYSNYNHSWQTWPGRLVLFYRVTWTWTWVWRDTIVEVVMWCFQFRTLGCLSDRLQWIGDSCWKATSIQTCKDCLFSSWPTSGMFQGDRIAP